MNNELLWKLIFREGEPLNQIILAQADNYKNHGICISERYHIKNMDPRHRVFKIYMLILSESFPMQP